ncbi:KH domain-containing protein [Candidatus Saccharibacteria bacterium oral taxon 955]|nr:KH domain-containing protein [Candidatus Saccharibacteria bacterium oral taxon 955]QHU89926.1 KH domain-containing protein [Candidatus Saccharibacteria bacterium oral taxon 955]QHU91733.1 KH domain-containing protein [Candidatus Saccharibacteria bacterium oral taxon 955]QJU06296.1 KH domain-containing protein [Candidatus Saccharibacteria bacterium oral taxon 955]
MNKQQSIEFARTFLQDIISFFGENIDVEADVEGDVIELYVESSDSNSILIGRNAETLRSLQYLVSTALRNKDASLTRVNVDIADYKKQREEKIAEKARGWIEEVRATGNSHIARINAADRRIVHRVASEYSDIRTYSEGEGRDRHIIIAQASA